MTRRLSPREVGALAEGVRRSRRALGLRPVELADYLGVSAVYLTALEFGKIGQPYPEVLDGLARLLELESRTELLWRAAAPVERVMEERVGQPARTPTGDAVERFLRERPRVA